MPRQGPSVRRLVAPDPVYNSVLVNQFVNKVLLGGKKSLAEQIVYGAMDRISKKTGEDPAKTLERAVENVKPAVEVRSRRIGGSSLAVPVEIPPRRSLTLAIRWLVNFARARKEKTMADRLAGELLDAANNAGASVKRREDLHKTAEANKAFSHFRW